MNYIKLINFFLLNILIIILKIKNDFVECEKNLNDCKVNHKNSPNNNELTANFVEDSKCDLSDYKGYGLNNSNIKKAVMQKQNIKTISTNAFDKVPYLTELNLCHNKIANLETEVFHKLRNLTTLKVCENELTHLNGGLLKNNQMLTAIYLGKNRIASIENDFINDLKYMKKLKNLYLVYNLCVHKNFDFTSEVDTNKLIIDLKNCHEADSIDCDNEPNDVIEFLSETQIWILLCFLMIALIIILYLLCILYKLKRKNENLKNLSKGKTQNNELIYADLDLPPSNKSQKNLGFNQPIYATIKKH